MKSKATLASNNLDRRKLLTKEKDGTETQELEVSSSTAQCPIISDKFHLHCTQLKARAHVLFLAFRCSWFLFLALEAVR
jgi:hypothetical protein